ncbi:MAG: rhodanese-like domain-containing protein [Hydrogenophaga sp.]|uniref:rhodanese-like domain-containing protein n=1 Tax=Hydrogenophaga sp. TaxID=1904254 RepID=UPI00276C49D3|nr:rhodanese-like domain-containing protein [Hydrogenophaga sp.]MDP2417062.1 rhodanese-like domain-containing protein [Hydrogenophaga sp.]MDZ4189468.1 rhodanese-like domain-containing protein [Hydrogenophaga sp.]
MNNLHFSAKLFTQHLVLLALLGASWAAQAQTRVLINPGDQGEQSRFAVYNAWKGAVEQALRKAAPGSTTTAVLSTDATADLQTTRSRIHDVFVAPAHVVGSAVRYGYAPVLGLERSVQAVLVAPAEGGITSLAQAQGKRLGLPLQDSVVTYLLRGEINAANTTIKRHFGPLFQTRYQDALLPCLQLRRCDVVAVERAVFDRWVAAGEKLRVIMETRSAPGLSVAVREDSKVNADAFRAALIESLVAGAVLSDGSKTVVLKGDDFNYVSTLGYFTPRSLGGAQVVEAEAVAQLLQRGARYIDTRTDVEFKAGHVPGAKLVPYVEKSAKDADYEAALDQFDTAQLGADRGLDLIFACNGAECWKSYKASQAALKAGFTKVHWFRGGFPEWRDAGQKIATGG